MSVVQFTYLQTGFLSTGFANHITNTNLDESKRAEYRVSSMKVRPADDKSKVLRIFWAILYQTNENNIYQH